MRKGNDYTFRVTFHKRFHVINWRDLTTEYTNDWFHLMLICYVMLCMLCYYGHRPLLSCCCFCCPESNITNKQTNKIENLLCRYWQSHRAYRAAALKCVKANNKTREKKHTTHIKLFDGFRIARTSCSFFLFLLLLPLLLLYCCCLLPAANQDRSIEERRTVESGMNVV